MNMHPVIFDTDSNSTIFEEKGNQYSAIRKVQWVNEDKQQEPNEDMAKLEIRRWMVSEDGDIGMKGFTFMTEEGPHNLVETMVTAGYGNTSTLIQNIVNRADFSSSIAELNGDIANAAEPLQGYFDSRNEFSDFISK